MPTPHLAGSPVPVLFLKATHKKQIWIPPYTRSDGVTVGGHLAFVHIADGHDPVKLLAGQGTYSQKQAHAKHAGASWFALLSDQDKVAALLHEATHLQDKASAAAVLSSFKKKILAAQTPTPAEWKAYDTAPEEKKAAILDAAQEASVFISLQTGYAKYKAANPAPAVGTKMNEPAPADVPPDAQPVSAIGQGGQEQHKKLVPHVSAAALASAGGVSAASYINSQIDVKQAAQDWLAENPSSKSADEMASALVAAGFYHVALELGIHAPQAKSPKVINATVTGNESMPAAAASVAIKAPQKVVDAIKEAQLPASNTNAKPVNAKLEALATLVQAGDVHGILGMSYGSNTYGIKVAKLANAALAALGSTHVVSAGQKAGSHAALPAAAPLNGGTQAAAVAPAPVASKPAVPYTKPAGAIAPASFSAAVGLTVDELPAKPDGVSMAPTWVKKAAQAAFMGDVAAIHLILAQMNPKKSPNTHAHINKILAALVAKQGGAAGPKEGDTKPGAGGTLVFKNGRWHQQEMPPAESSWGFAECNWGFSGFPTQCADLPDGGGIVVVNGGSEGYEIMTTDPDGEPLLTEHFTTLADVVAFAARHGAPAFAETDLKKLDPAYGAATPAAPPLKGKLFHNTEPGHHKFWSVALDGAKLITQYGPIGKKGASTVKEFPSAALAAQAHQALVAQKIKGKYKLQGDIAMHTGAAIATAAPAKPTVHVTKPSKVAGATATVTTSESIEAWTKTGGQKGYNEGGTYEDAAGVAWYCKFPAGGEKVAKNEWLAAKLYALAGVAVADVKLVNLGGKIGIASKIINGAKQDKAALLAGKAKGLLSGFAVDAWLANWDTVGNNPAKGYDNILIHADGAAHRIDAGGALTYGGAGGKKQAFGDQVIELQTMLDPNKNKHTAAVFGKMSQGDIAASVAKVAAIADSAITQHCLAYGPGDLAEKQAMAKKLIARKADMLTQYPAAAVIAAKRAAKGHTAAQAADIHLDPTKLPVDASNLPAMHNFMNWQNSGKPISDKPYVQQNIKDEQAIHAAALKGNLTALENYHFMAVDQLTGAEIGLKPIAQHPSAHVKSFYESCIAFLDQIANPPAPLKIFDGTISDNIKDLSDAFPPKLFGVGVSKVAANEKIGFWIALGVNANIERFKPKKTMLANLIAGIKEKGKALYAKYNGNVKHFIKTVQASGHNNKPYREGAELDHSGKSTRAILHDLYHAAAVKPAGTTISKWIDMPDEMVAQFLSAPEGLVFQNPGSMCCSMDATATAGFGHHRVTIHYAEGARAIDTFGSGAFKGELEITTLPGQRFMVLGRKMVNDDKKVGQRLELEVLMLPPDQTYVDRILKN